MGWQGVCLAGVWEPQARGGTWGLCGEQEKKCGAALKTGTPQRNVARGCECGRLCEWVRGWVLPTYPCVEENVSHSLWPIYP